jgi:hypothetical protein
VKRPGFILLSLLLASLVAQSVNGSSSYRYAYLSNVDGELSLQRATELSPEPGTRNEPILPGDRIWTHGSSFAEVRIADAVFLRLSENTKVDFVDLDTGILLRIWSGSVIVKLLEGLDDVRVDSPGGSVRPTMEGSYRIDAKEGDVLTLTVSRGAAELASNVASVVVRSGESSEVSAGRSPDVPRPFNTAGYDALDSWSDRLDQRTSSVREIQVERIPREVRRYTRELSYYGDWYVEPSYGYVWYPRVSYGWAPYRDGRWCYTRYGYTWVSYEPWGWAPYHYGRWGHGHRGWYWIPGSTWAPAWVSFALGPFWIGWSPLGYHNQPVYGFHRSHYYRRTHGGRVVHGDELSGWSFSTRDDFTRGTAQRRLEPNLVQASSAGVRVLDGGTVLDRDLSPRGFAGERGDARRGGFAGTSPRRIESEIAERTATAAPRTRREGSTASPLERGRPVMGTGGVVSETPSAEPREPARSRSGLTATRVFRTGPPERSPSSAPGERPRGSFVERERNVESRERGSGIVVRSPIGSRDRGELRHPDAGSARSREGASVERARPVERAPRSGSGGLRSSPIGPTPRATTPTTRAPRESGAVRTPRVETGGPRESGGARAIERSSPRSSPRSEGAVERGSSSGPSRGPLAAGSPRTGRSKPREQ